MSLPTNRAVILDDHRTEKNHVDLTFGLTIGSSLLEIMLVLVIISLIMLLSIRYYQNSQTSSMIANTLAKIQMITTAMDDLTLGATDGYDTLVSSTNLQNALGAKNSVTDWGYTITVASNTKTTYIVNLADTTNKMPYQVCVMLKPKLTQNPRYITSSTCATAGSAFAYTYNNTADL